MARSGTVSARIDPDTKEAAELVLDRMGIPPSTLINMVYKMVIQCDGLPFDMRLLRREPVSADDLSDEALVERILARYRRSLEGEGVDAGEFAEAFRRKNGTPR